MRTRITKIIKKTIITGFTAAMVLACSSCGGEKSSDKNNVIELNWYTCEGGTIEDLASVMETANEYSKDKIGVTVDIHYVDSDKLNEITDSDGDYDMIFASDWLNRFDMKAEAGKFYNITDLVKMKLHSYMKL